MTREHTDSVLRQAFQRASQERVPIVLASTTGGTAREMLRIVGVETGRLIIVSHDNRQVPKTWQFEAEMMEQLKERGFPVLRNYPVVPFPIQLLRRLSRIFGISTTNDRDQLLEEMLGIGGRVCFQITRLALQEREIHEHDRIVAVAGESSGANTALLLQIESIRPVRITLLEMITPRRDP